MDWLVDEPEENTVTPTETWKVLIVDDDDEVHKVTRLSLSAFSFENKTLEFISAYSGNEAKGILSHRDDIALVLLDVVMESDDAGLNVANYIRHELDNYYTRVVLRTGQAGFAPINDVMQHYDIDGYLAKTEITKHKLNHIFYIALRSYRDLVRIQKYQKGLEALINAIANLTQMDEVLELAQAVMAQLGCVLNAEQAEFIIQDADIFALAKNENDTWRVVIDAEKSAMLTKSESLDGSANQYKALTDRVLGAKQSVFEHPYYVNYYRSERGTETIFLVKTEQALNKESKKLLHAFSVQVVLTLENLLIK